MDFFLDFSCAFGLKNLLAGVILFSQEMGYFCISGEN